MDDHLYDTSWTLYVVRSAKTSYRVLLAADQRALDRRAKQFHDFVHVNKPAYDSDSENERTGGLRGCAWKALRDGSRAEDALGTLGEGILVTLVYDKATYKFALCGGDAENPLSLLLAKGPATAVKRFTAFLGDAFHASVEPLKLPTALLQTGLESYLNALHSARLQDTCSLLDADPTQTPSVHLLKSVLGNLRITITFSAPIAPQLKSLDLDIPPETADQFVATTTQKHGRNARSAAPKSVLGLVAHHLQETTGLTIPVVAAGGAQSSTQANGQGASEGEDDDDVAVVMRVSKITCAAFAVSVDGRLKFASKAVDTAVQFEDVVRTANRDLLHRIERQAVRRSLAD